MPTTAIISEPGITFEPGRNKYRLEVRVRPYPPRRVRVKADTPVAAMRAWRAQQIAELEAARGELARTAAATADPLAPTKARQAGTIATLRDDVDFYIAHKMRAAKGGPLHPHTKIQFTRWLRKAAATEIGRLPRQLVTGAMWAALLAQWERYGIPVSADDGVLKANGERRRIVTPGRLDVDTCNKVRSAWMGFYRIMNEGTELSNPIKFVPRRTPKAAVARGFDMADAHKILAHMTPGTRTYARLCLMLVLGVRPCEIMRIVPAKHWRRKARELQVMTAKGGVGRTLPLDDYAVGALELLDAAVDGWGTFTSAPYARMFHAAVKRAGLESLEPCKPYDLRHTFGTEAYRQSGDIEAVGKSLGQSSLAITQRYVIGAVNARVAAVCGQVAGAFPKLRKQPRRRGALRAV
jgi:integrase